MPTVLRLNSLRVIVYPNDHAPAHVHVRSADGEAVFGLNCPDGPPELRSLHGLSSREAGRIQERLAVHVPSLCGKWTEIHGGL